MPRRAATPHQHRAETPDRPDGGETRTSRWRRLRRPLAVSAAALALTAGVVATGVAASEGRPTDTAAAALAAAQVDRPAPALAGDDRVSTVSRSGSRLSATSVDRTKQRLLHERSGGQVTRTKHVAPSDPRYIARTMLGEFGFGSDQFGCLDALWNRESGWRVNASNPSSAAYGIPQALPGSKMASAGGDWATNPATQIRWGLGYIQGSYGSPCGAWSHSEAYGWY